MVRNIENGVVLMKLWKSCDSNFMYTRTQDENDTRKNNLRYKNSERL